MLDDLAAEHIRSGLEKSYSERISGNLLDGTAKRERRLITQTDDVAKFCLSAAKISGLVSLVVGGLLLIVYLHSEGAPVPSSDSSISVLLSLVSLSFFFILLVVLSFVLLPMYQKLVKTKDRRKIYLSVSRAERSKSKIIRSGKALLRYWQDYGGFLSFAALLFCLVWGKDSPQITMAGWIIWAVMLLAWISHFLFRPRPGEAYDLYAGNFYSTLSYGVLSILSIAILRQGSSGFGNAPIALACVGSLVVVHYLLQFWITDWWRLFTVSTTLVFASIMFGPGLPFWGGASLRLLGMGGNIPVALRVRSSGIPGGPATFAEITGCLVLATGSDIMIRPTSRKADCQLHPVWVPEDRSPTLEAYSEVDRYLRSDVVRISSYPNSCGTVDGLADPSCSGSEIRPR